eukprot:SAG11_NODE_15815_length_565_cov_1.630901_1_plen_81_part_10
MACIINICTLLSQGTKSNKPQPKCGACDGHGIRIALRHMGPMVQQMRVRCDACGGAGSVEDPADICGAPECLLSLARLRPT